MKCYFNEDGTMFLYAKGNTHPEIPGKVCVEVPDELNIKKQVKYNGNLITLEVTQSELNDLLQNHLSVYSNARKQEYPSIVDQLDMLYWDKVNGTNNWQITIESIKNKYPKNEV